MFFQQMFYIKYIHHVFSTDLSINIHVIIQYKNKQNNKLLQQILLNNKFIDFLNCKLFKFHVTPFLCKRKKSTYQ